MKGLVIWAHSYCRSTLAFYKELGTQFNVPFEIYILHNDYSLRKKVGFSEKEFENLNIHFIGDEEEKAFDCLASHKDWNHIFASYQKADLYSLLIAKAIKQDIIYAIASEAPCNMASRISQRILKWIYINYVLPIKLMRFVRHADFIINYSGYYDEALNKLGWQNKIISCGYFPPPIPSSHCVKRSEDNWYNFTVLLSGIHQWHRSPQILLKALCILQKKGIHFKCYITQDGPLLFQLKRYVERHSLKNIEFLGFVSMDRLIELYETCSVYVGCGSYEPWGMRLNDVLQCGSPLIISRGMGGAKLIDDYQCGLAFDKGDYKMLATQLEILIRHKDKYIECANNAYNAFSHISPKSKATEMVNIIRGKYSNWR